MKNKILTGENWQGRVRSMLGVDAAFLPDTDIEMPEIVQVAEANIIELVPGYETIPDDKRVYLESATVYECAIQVCGSMPARIPLKESGPHVSFELDIDWEKRKADFAEKRDIHISKLVKMPDVTYFAIS